MVNFKIFGLSIIFLVSIFLTSAAPASAGSLLDETATGLNGQTNGAIFDNMVDDMFANTNTISTISGDKLWVPWFKTSSRSEVEDLQNGANCNSGQTIDFSHSCMVTDEFSQVGILVSMGKDQSRMDKFYNTVVASKSKYGSLPAWRIYRNGDTIEACRPNINGNCDTASDGSARIIIALYTASKNIHFTNSAQKTKYAELATKMANDMLTYEVEKTCRPTRYGTVCNWLAGGANVKATGISSNDFAYTGYYPDAIIAMLAAYSSTGDSKFYNAAKDFTTNYLQAAKFTGSSFTAPPGKSFKWEVDAYGVPTAKCTNTCSPVMWDGYDASRAVGICQANYYAKQMGLELPYLQGYCDLLTSKHMSNTITAPLQFYPDGGAASESQSSCFAQGLQSMHLAGANTALYKEALNSALAHYTPATKSFDNAPAFGVYTQSFAVRSLGMGVGRDKGAFVAYAPIQTPTTATNLKTSATTQTATKTGIAALSDSCTYGSSNTPAQKKTDSTNGGCRTIVWSTPAGDIKTFACEKPNNYIEIYNQGSPANFKFKACLANGCITKDNGFARFIPTTAQTIPSSASTKPAPAKYAGIASLSIHGSYESSQARVISDVTSGTCRTVVFSTANGDVKILGCEKEERTVEVYMQSCPNNLAFKACMGQGCVDNYSGFAKFSV